MLLMNSKVKKYIGHIFTLICVVLVVLTSIEVVSAAIDSRPPSLFGYSVSYVPTESMEPEIEAGEYIYYKTTSFDEVKENDVIIYKSKTGQMKGNYIVHRIVEKHEDYLVVKGDNNPINDSEQVTADMVYGKYIDKVEVLKKIIKSIKVDFN